MGLDAGLPSRAPQGLTGLRERIPSWLPTLLVAVAIYAVVLVASTSGWINAYWYGVIQMAVVAAVSALGLNLIYGFNGQFSLGHVGFYAIGAYTSALISKDFVSQWSGGPLLALSWIIAGQVGVLSILMLVNRMRVGHVRAALGTWLSARLAAREVWPIQTLVSLFMVAVAIVGGVLVAWGLRMALLPLLNVVLLNIPAAVAEQLVFILALVNGASLAALVGYLVGLPLLRLNSDYLGIATLGFAIMVYTALQNSDQVIATMKGARGMVAIPRWTTWTWGFGALVVVAIVMRNMIHSSYGRGILAIREDEIAAKTMGIDVARLKALAFASGAFFAGIAGGLYAHLYGFLHPSTFNFVKGFDPMIIIVFGGLGSMTGTLMASGIFVLIIEGLRVVLPQGFEDWRFVVYPILLLLIMLLRQEGLLGTREWGWFRAPVPGRRRTEPDPAPAAASALGEEGPQHA